MYHFFVNASVITIASPNETPHNFLKPYKEKTRFTYSEKTDLLKYIVQVESSHFPIQIELVSMDIENTMDHLLSHYSMIESAGGLVLNDLNQLLMIYRNSKWDLPKGKVEKDEEYDKAAIREVEEETAASNLLLQEKLDSTYHTYRMEGKRTMKRTHWYRMRTDSKEKLVPQNIEGILEAKWVEKSYLRNYLDTSFTSVAELVNKYVLGA